MEVFSCHKILISVHKVNKGVICMVWIVMLLIFILIGSSVLQFIFSQQAQSKRRLGLAYEVFYTLIIIYSTVIIGFAILYFAFSLHDIILLENRNEGTISILELWWKSLYFSGVTMLTIGYGDISPIGIGRVFAIVQALIGFILPTAFVLKVVHINYETKQET